MFGFLPNNLFTNHVGQSTSGLSPRLWSRVTGSMMASDGSRRLHLVGDDFVAMTPGLSTGSAFHCEHPYTLFRDDTTNNTCAILADENGGVLAFAQDASCGANEEAGIELGAAAGQLGQISDTAGADFLTAFECRVKIGHVTDGDVGMIIGLAEPAIAVNGGVIDATGGPKADKSFIGFSVLEDDCDSVDFCYQGTDQTRNDLITDCHTLVADTFVKLGFIYDPSAPTSKRITVYVDNVEQSTYVTGALIALPAFPDAEALTFACVTKAIDGSNAIETAIDWWAFAQLI